MSKNLIKKIIIFSIAFILILSIFAFSLVKPEYKPKEVRSNPKANSGVLDLSAWNWKQDGTVSLKGQWEFYWQELYQPEDFKNKDMTRQRKLITLPRAWNKYILDGEKLSGDGYATYRLLIYHTPGEILGIDIPRILTAHKLWVNGKLTASAGKVTKNKQQMIPQYLPQVKYFMPDSDTIEIVIQVANFRHRSGGVLENLKIGSASQISSIHNRNIALELFLFGGLFIIGFYHLALYIFRIKDKSTLYFGIYSILISLRTLLVGEIFLIHIFPDLNWEIAHNIQTLAYYLGVPLVILFLESIFRDDMFEKINKFIYSFAFLFTLLVLLTPVKIFSRFNPIYQFFSLFVFLYALYIVVVTCYRRREGAYFIGIGVSVLIFYTVNDIIFHSIVLADSGNHFLRKFITRGNLSSWGLLIFVFTQSLVLAKKFSKSFSKVESLSGQLQQINANLEEKIKERTHALQASKEELKDAYQSVSRSEKSLQDLIQNISHDLRTPLSAIKGYANAILDGIVISTEQENKYLKKIIDKINYLNHMVQELFELSQLQARQIELEVSQIPVNRFIESISERFSFDMMDKKRIFKINCLTSQDEIELKNFYVQVDNKKIDRVFSNLLNNAVKYSTDGSYIEMYFKIMEDKEKMLIEISDNGIGIPQEDLPHIFKRFYRVSKARQTSNGNGLGLAIVKEIIEYNNGQIWVKSKPGKGSHFYFTIPIYQTVK